jgi:uncharacterized protein (DUF1015 family)
MDNDTPPSTIPRPTGLVLAPFRALRYDPQRVDLASVLAPPYDVIDASERAQLAGRSPHNVVRLTLPEAAEAGQSPYDTARATMSGWRDDGVLRPDDRPALYVYEESADGHVQRGLVGALGLTPAADGIVLPHENTMAGPVADRLALMTAVAADLEPIFLVYDGGGAASRLVAEADRVEPDGHHRYATFLRYQADRHSAADGEGPWDLGLAFLVDGSAFGPQVYAIHRVVPGLPAQEAAARAESGFAVRAVGSVDEGLDALAKAGVDGPAFLVADSHTSWLLTDPDPSRLAAALPADRSAAFRRLDVTVAHLYLIREIWGLEDREEVVDYRHDVPAALEAAHSSGGCALLLNPTPVADVAAVAAAGERMPRKSTLFVPKPATGLLIRAFADA